MPLSEPLYHLPVNPLFPKGCVCPCIVCVCLSMCCVCTINGRKTEERKIASGVMRTVSVSPIHYHCSFDTCLITNTIGFVGFGKYLQHVYFAP